MKIGGIVQTRTVSYWIVRLGLSWPNPNHCCHSRCCACVAVGNSVVKPVEGRVLRAEACPDTGYACVCVPLSVPLCVFAMVCS